MGVKGLWKIISDSGRPIALETLEHKVIAVDVSIWLHQAVQGMRGLGGSSVANSHLLVLFHRICKLLFYGIKPVFIFDGGVPRLKKQTVAARRLKREIASKNTSKVRERLLSNLLKSQAVRKVLGKRGAGPSEHHIAQQIKNVNKDIFELPPLPVGSKFEEQQSQTELINETETMFTSLHDFNSNDDSFKDLPLQTKHEVMCDLQGTRKENSWNSINEMPQEANSFACYQMERLLKRNKFQVDLDTIRLQIQRDHTAELEAQLFEELEEHVSFTNRIVSKEHVSFTNRIISEDVHSIIVKSKEMQEPVSNIFAEEKIIKTQKAVTKSDFLTELAKQGIVNQDKLEDSSASDSEFSDEENMLYKNQSKLEQISFMKALDCVLDNGTELSQDEIYTLIQQSRKDIIVDAPRTVDTSKPSTSKQSDMWQATSSDDDDDFIDVPEPDGDKYGVSISPLKPSDGSESSKSNIDAIRSSKSSSLFLKIIQQKLDDIKPGTSTNIRKTLSPEKSADPAGLKISFDIKSYKPATEDIFSDIFPTPRMTGPAVDKEIRHSITKQIKSGSITKSTAGHLFNQNRSIVPSKMNFPEKAIPNDPQVLSDIYDAMDVEKNTRNNIITEEVVVVSTDDSVLSSLQTDNKSSSPSEKDAEFGMELNLKEQGAVSTSCELRDSIKFIDVATEIPSDNVNNSSIYDAPETVFNVKTDINVDSQGELNNTYVSNTSNEIDATVGIQLRELNNINNLSKVSILSPPKYSKSDLINLETNLIAEQKSLVSQMQTMDRIAASISEQKFEEAKELLMLFGIPYLVSPMEAEAQCAFLNSTNLTHGTITDDSDIFLFGGNCVYKNFFNHLKYVEMFDLTNIHHLYGLSRMKMIQLALLTGSDYTVGIESVGAVLAMELLSEFPSDNMEGLLKLKRSWISLQNTKVTSSGVRSKICNLHLPECFPSKEVFDAYLNPDVDNCTDKFSWGIPNVERLTKFTGDKFGWNVSKTSEILLPVLKKMDNKSTQRRLDSYFNRITLTKEPNIKSKRLLEAIKTSRIEQALPILKSMERRNSSKKSILIPDPPRPKESRPIKRKPKSNSAAVKKSKQECVLGKEKINADDTLPLVKPLTKEEMKQKNFEQLLKTPKIPQIEKEKLEKALKLQKAIKLFSKT